MPGEHRLNSYHAVMEIIDMFFTLILDLFQSFLPTLIQLIIDILTGSGGAVV